MKTFYKQQAAFDSLQPGECVFQNQTNGQRYYVACTNHEYWTKYLSNGDRFGYELIMKDKPCHLYIDLDVNKEKYPSIHVTEIWGILEKWIDVSLIEHFNIKEEDIVKRLHSSSNEKKGSMHIIYNIKGRIFQSNAHVGAFMRCIAVLIESQNKEDMTIFDNKFVDMAIYTQNRLFRMLGCAKWGTARYLTNGEEYTYENWVKNKVQPVETNDEFIEVKDHDGSEVRYNSSFGIIVDADDHLKAIVDHISETHADVMRVCEFPITMSYACNLNTKVCPFKGEAHSKNRLYAVINLFNCTYSIRCHSQQCKHKFNGPYDIPCHAKDSIKPFLERTIIHPPIIQL
jgi:hypothetical protein